MNITSILDVWKFSPDEILQKWIFVHLFIYPVFLAVDVCANSASSCHDSPEFQSKISCKALETGIVYTVKLQAVDWSTIKFWNFLAKGHST